MTNNQHKFTAWLVVALCLGLIFCASPVFARQSKDSVIIVVLKGKGDLMAPEDAPVEGALCYETDLFDAASDRIIGTGIDCLENVVADPDSGVITLDRTTEFSFPQGKLAAAGITTVAPIIDGSPGFSHVVGDIPAAGTDSVVYGTRRFRRARGSVRLSGAVDLSDFPNSTTFNCVFLIDLEKRRPDRRHRSKFEKKYLP